MAVNEPIPRAEPEGEVCLRCHNSLATSESLIHLLRRYKMLVIKVMHSVPRNKTNQNLKAEKEPECSKRVYHDSVAFSSSQAYKM